MQWSSCGTLSGYNGQWNSFGALPHYRGEWAIEHLLYTATEHGAVELLGYTALLRGGGGLVEPVRQTVTMYRSAPDCMLHTTTLRGLQLLSGCRPPPPPPC